MSGKMVNRAIVLVCLSTSSEGYFLTFIYSQFELSIFFNVIIFLLIFQVQNGKHYII